MTTTHADTLDPTDRYIRDSRRELLARTPLPLPLDRRRQGVAEAQGVEDRIVGGFEGDVGFFLRPVALLVHRVEVNVNAMRNRMAVLVFWETPIMPPRI